MSINQWYWQCCYATCLNNLNVFIIREEKRWGMPWEGRDRYLGGEGCGWWGCKCTGIQQMHSTPKEQLFLLLYKKAISFENFIFLNDNIQIL